MQKPYHWRGLKLSKLNIIPTYRVGLLRNSCRKDRSRQTDPRIGIAAACLRVGVFCGFIEIHPVSVYRFYT